VRHPHSPAGRSMCSTVYRGTVASCCFIDGRISVTGTGNSASPVALHYARGERNGPLETGEQLDLNVALASPDGKHLAINASPGQSNVWLIDKSADANR